MLVTGLVFAQTEKVPGGPQKGVPMHDMVVKENIPQDTGAVKIPKIYFVSPKDGETVPGTFTAKFEAEGMSVKKSGKVEMTSGHFHVLVNTAPIAEGEIIPKNEKHLHFAHGQKEAKLTLPPGTHKLTLQFSDGSHRAYTKLLTHEITVSVK